MKLAAYIDNTEVAARALARRLQVDAHRNLRRLEAYHGEALDLPAQQWADIGAELATWSETDWRAVRDRRGAVVELLAATELAENPNAPPPRNDHVPARDVDHVKE